MSVDLNAISNSAQARVAIERGYFKGEKLSQSDVQQLREKFPEIKQEAKDDNQYPDFTVQDMNSTLLTSGASMGAGVGANATTKQVGAFGNGAPKTGTPNAGATTSPGNASNAGTTSNPGSTTQSSGSGGTEVNADAMKSKADSAKSNNIALYAAAGVVAAGAAYYKIAKPGEEKNQEVIQAIQQDLPALDADNQAKTEESIAAQEGAQAFAEEAQAAVEEAEEALADNEAAATEGNDSMEFLAKLIESGEATEEDIEEYNSLKEKHGGILKDNEGLQEDVIDAVGAQADAIEGLDEIFVAANETIATNDEINSELLAKGEKAEKQAQTHEIIAGVGSVAGQAVGIAGGIVAAKDAAKPFVGWGLVAADIAAGIVGQVSGSVMGAESQKQGMFKDNAANEQAIANNVADNSNIAKGTVDTMQTDTQTLGENTRGTEIEVPEIDEAPEADPSKAPEKPEEGENEEGGSADAAASLFGAAGKVEDTKTGSAGENDDGNGKKVKGASGSSGTK